jgi:putative transcriptional regulator
MLDPGTLLVAAPPLVDPNFYRTVLLTCRHDEDGALALVLNRPTDLMIENHLPQWSELADPHVWIGGPVEPEMAIGLGEGIAAGPGWTPVVGTLGLVDVSLPPEAFPGLQRLRIFAGYAGWSSGQLEAELAEGAWFAVPGFPDDVFPDEATDVWAAVLRRQGGALALFASYPPDPTLN